MKRHQYGATIFINKIYMHVYTNDMEGRYTRKRGVGYLPTIGIFNSPWSPVDLDKFPEDILILARRNYEVFPDLSDSSRHRRSVISILENGAGSIFIQKDQLSPTSSRRIDSSGPKPKVGDANSKPLSIAGRVKLSVHLG